MINSSDEYEPAMPADARAQLLSALKEKAKELDAVKLVLAGLRSQRTVETNLLRSGTLSPVQRAISKSTKTLLDEQIKMHMMEERNLAKAVKDASDALKAAERAAKAAERAAKAARRAAKKSSRKTSGDTDSTTSAQDDPAHE